jgi:hypothetical protein
MGELKAMMPKLMASKVTVKKLNPETGELETVAESGEGKGDIPEPIQDVIKTAKKTNSKLKKKDDK